MNRSLSFLYEGIRYFTTLQDDYIRSMHPDGNVITMGEAVATAGIASALSQPWKLRNPVQIPILSENVSINRVDDKTFEVTGDIEVDGSKYKVELTSERLDWFEEAEEPVAEETAEEPEPEVQGEPEPEVEETKEETEVEETKEEPEVVEETEEVSEPYPILIEPKEEPKPEPTVQRESAPMVQQESTPIRTHREELVIGGTCKVPAISRGVPVRGRTTSALAKRLKNSAIQSFPTAPAKEPTLVGKFIGRKFPHTLEVEEPAPAPVVAEEPKAVEEPKPKEPVRTEYRYFEDTPSKEEKKEETSPKLTSLHGRDLLGDAVEVPTVDQTSAARSPMFKGFDADKFYRELPDETREILEKIPLECMKGNITESTSLSINEDELKRQGSAYCITNRWHVYGDWYYIDVVHHMSRFYFNEKENVSSEISLSVFKKWRMYKEQHNGDTNE